ncbi:MAG: stage IV sporulation protein A [Clostridia bacterium]|nr:stage IV sporulation protein A [Clostridia bacterium]
MDKAQLYQDIAKRTQGDIYIGVVGPVRTGKSTFIKRFSELLLLPNIENEYVRARVIDELPQSGAGRTVMTTQPRFVPSEAVEIQLDENVTCSVRLVDCVGYVVPDAAGLTENGETRMVTTPWFDRDIPFAEAAEIGTRKVIAEHATVGIVITTDGTITELGRESYLGAEAQAIRDVQATKKPYLVVVNSAAPDGAAAEETADYLRETFGVEPLVLNLLQLGEKTLSELLTGMLYAFPLKLLNVSLPSYLRALPPENPLLQRILEPLKALLPSVRAVRDVDRVIACLSEPEGFRPALLESLSLGDGTAVVAMRPEEGVFYSVLTEACGCEIRDDYELMSAISGFVAAKKAYDRISDALEKAKQTGYGIVPPEPAEMELLDPEIVRQGSKFGVKLHARASGLHIVRVDIDSEVNPIVGTEQQSEALLRYLNDTFEGDPNAIWETNLFGKSLYDLVLEGMRGKVNGMNDEVQQKMQGAIQQIVNSNCNGLICITL